MSQTFIIEIRKKKIPSSAIVTSAKILKAILRSDLERPRPKDQTPGIPGSGKKHSYLNVHNHTGRIYLVVQHFKFVLKALRLKHS